jgi:NhaA family Na+:H+ antiporter
LNWSLLIAGGFLTGIGFTMSLFIAGLAFPPAMLNSAKIGVLCGSVVSAALGLLALTWSTHRKTDQLDSM